MITPRDVFWRLKHLLTCGHWSQCLLCRCLLHEGDELFPYYIILTWVAFEFSILLPYR